MLMSKLTEYTKSNHALLIWVSSCLQDYFLVFINSSWITSLKKRCFFHFHKYFKCCFKKSLKRIFQLRLPIKFPKPYKYWVLSCVSFFKTFIPSVFLWDGYPFKCSLVIYTFPFWNAFQLFCLSSYIFNQFIEIREINSLYVISIINISF